MATLNTTVKLETSSSVAGVLKLDFTNTQPFTIGDVAGDDLTVNALTSLVATGYGATAYVYAVNTASDATHTIALMTDAGVQWGTLEAGEWGFFAIPNGTGFKVQADAGVPVLNYVIMKKA
tara:strand:- start:292 stop:654 length:363 start_codon:yes stop_codon:yes gene_type:complete